jgi:hypothetical protein
MSSLRRDRAAAAEVAARGPAPCASCLMSRPHSNPNRPGRARWQGAFLDSAVAATLAAAATTAVLGTPPTPPVRNTNPQRAVNRTDEDRPIYYPRLAHEEPDEQTASETDRLLREFFDLHTAMRYEQAAAVADRLIEIAPSLPQAHYNRACVMGRLQRENEALDSLARAIDCGWRDYVHFSVDPDLASVRHTARYAELARRLQSLIAWDKRVLGAPTQPGRADELHRAAPEVLQRLGAPAATVAVIGGGRVSWTTSAAADADRRSTVPGPDEAIEVSSLVRLFALVALLQQPPQDGGIMDGPGHSRGPVLRQAGHNPSGSGAPSAGRSPPSAYEETDLVTAVETATGRSFDAYCRTRILDPLGMNRTRFADSSGGSGPAVYSTAEDLGRLLTALCDAAPEAGAPLLDEGSFKQLVASGAQFGLETTTDLDSAAAGLQLVHRSGNCVALLRWFPHQGRGLVILTGSQEGTGAARRIAGLLLPQ